MGWFKTPASATRHDDSDRGKESVEPALTMPATGIDPDWRERIDLAKRAYEEGKKLREGKPITFRIPALESGRWPWLSQTGWSEARYTTPSTLRDTSAKH